MGKLKVTTYENLDEFGEALGINSNVRKLKQSIAKKIVSHCEENKLDKVSLKKVAKIKKSQVEDIHNGILGKYTIDDLVKVLTALNISATVRFKSL